MRHQPEIVEGISVPFPDSDPDLETPLGRLKYLRKILEAHPVDHFYMSGFFYFEHEQPPIKNRPTKEGGLRACNACVVGTIALDWRFNPSEDPAQYVFSQHFELAEFFGVPSISWGSLTDSDRGNVPKAEILSDIDRLIAGQE